MSNYNYGWGDFFTDLAGVAVETAVAGGAAYAISKNMEQAVNQLLQFSEEEAIRELSDAIPRLNQEGWNLFHNCLADKARNNDFANVLLTFSISIREATAELEQLLAYSTKEALELIADILPYKNELEQMAFLGTLQTYASANVKAKALFNKLNIEAARQAQPIVLQLQSRTGGSAVPLELLSIPGGSFWMGEEDYEYSRHRVNLPPFWMSRYPVTQAQYEAVMGYNPVGNLSFNRVILAPDHPVVWVTWDNAVEFCQRLAQQERGGRITLPTEAQWEYACRAGTETAFYFGNHLSTDQASFDGDETDDYQQGEDQHWEHTTPVGNFPANKWGLQDMHGNVWEWCLDQWYDGYEDKPEALKRDGSIPWTEKNTAMMVDYEAFRVLRGGSWSNYAMSCRSSCREFGDRENSYNNWGFRIVFSPR